MTREKLSIAKISRPRISRLVERQRLFRILDREHARPILWVTASAGSGKTSLIAGYLEARKLPCIWYQVDQGDADPAGVFYYLGLAAKRAAPRFRTPLPLLTPEYLAGLPVFTKRYFESFFSRLKPGSVLVFDNFQDAPPGSGFHEVLVEGLAAVPEGIRVIIISRGEPASAFARLLVSGGMVALQWSELRFTLEETKALVRVRSGARIPEASVEKIHALTDGWAAGLVLMLSRAEAGADGPQAAGEHAPDEVFNFFACEVFDKLDSETRDFLLLASFLPRMTVRAAAALTGNDHAAAILSGLCRDHFFTNRIEGQEALYVFHPLFRNFLLARSLASLSREGAARLRKKAAALLEEAGQKEDAVALLLEAADGAAALRLILGLADALTAQGRRKTVAGWLLSLPPDVIEETPWAHYWIGVCKMHGDPYAGREHLVRAYRRFKQDGDRSGLFLAWVRIVETIFFGWGEKRETWIREFDEITSTDPSMPSPELAARTTVSMFSLLMLWTKRRDDVALWEQKVSAIAAHCPPGLMKMQICHLLVIYHLWIGDLGRVEAILHSLGKPQGAPEDNALAHIIWCDMNAQYAWVTADYETCISSVRQGLELSARTGVHVLDPYLFKYGISAAVSLNHPADAAELLRAMSARPMTNPMFRSFYHYLSSLAHWKLGRIKAAVEDGRIALDIVGDLDYRVGPYCCFIMMSLACREDGQFDAADAHLARAGDVAGGANYLEFITLFVSARYALDRGRHGEFGDLVRRAMRIGARQGFLNFAWWQPAFMSRACARALDEGWEPDYARRLIRTHGLTPEGPVESWPYPVKITTLGAFEISLDGKPLVFSGKVQKKPLELLKALIAFGGENVVEDRIVEALWPDAEGDLGHRSFETTLYRLRNLLGRDEALRLQDGLLTLDRRFCRVDIWELASVADQVEEHGECEAGSGKDADRVIALCGKAMTWYRGHFLPGDAARSWTISTRERMRTKFINLVVMLGSYWERSGAWRKALDCYTQGLEVDGLVEEFYRRSMLCHIRLGQRGQAREAYQRCCAVLRHELRIDPSPALSLLYESLGSID